MDLEIQMVLINEFGEFVGRKVIINMEQYQGFLNLSKTFYTAGFELTCEDGSFMIFPPDIVQKSILKIKKRVIEKENE